MNKKLLELLDRYRKTIEQLEKRQLKAERQDRRELQVGWEYAAATYETVMEDIEKILQEPPVKEDGTPYVWIS